MEPAEPSNVAAGMSDREDRVRRLLADHGRTWCEELAIPVGRNTPQPLFRWLVAALLLSARISAALAARAADSLYRAGLNDAKAMAGAGWERRAGILNEAGYGRYDESTSTRLGDTSALVLERYRGDLRRLRAAAGGDTGRAIALLEEFKGIGPLGAAIFCREAQGSWDELYPFADARTLEAAKTVGLPHGVDGLAKLVDRAEFPRLLAALTRARLAKRLGDYRG